MVLYQCCRCGYETKHKGSFIKHINRKKMCRPILEDCSIEYIKNKYNLTLEPIVPKKCENPPQNSSKFPHFPSFCEEVKQNQKVQNSLILGGNVKKLPHKMRKSAPKNVHICENCLREFSRGDNLKRHQKKCEENGREFWEIKEQMKELIDEHKKEKEEFKEIMKEKDKLIDAHKEVMKETVENLIIDFSKKGGTVNFNNDNSHTTVNNTVNNTININNFGNENIKYLNKDYLSNLLECAFTALPKLIEKIHFNPEHPENHNIMITNKKQPYVRVLKNDQWQLQDKQETLDHLLDEKYYILENHYSNVEKKEELTEKMEDVMGRFRNRYTDDKELQKKLNKETELIILNKGEI